MVTRLEGSNTGAVAAPSASAAPDASSSADGRQAALQRTLQGMIGQQVQASVISRYNDGSALVRVQDNTMRMVLPANIEAGTQVPLTVIAAEPRPTFELNNAAGNPSALVYTENLPAGEGDLVYTNLPSQDALPGGGRPGQPGTADPSGAAAYAAEAALAGEEGAAGGTAGALAGAAGGAEDAAGTGAAGPGGANGAAGADGAEGAAGGAAGPGGSGTAANGSGIAGGAAGAGGAAAAAGAGGPGGFGAAFGAGGAGDAAGANGAAGRGGLAGGAAGADGAAGAGAPGLAGGAGDLAGLGSPGSAAGNAAALAAGLAAGANPASAAAAAANAAAAAANAEAANPAALSAALQASGQSAGAKAQSLAAQLLEKAPLTPASDLPDLAPSSPSANLSSAARVLTSMLSAAQGAAASLVGKTALFSGTPDTGQLAQRLSDTIAQSGLFYESHVAQWAKGDRSLPDLMREPQMQQLQLLQRQADGGTAARSGPDLSAAQMINQQLNAQEQARVQWNGQAWPGQPMQWEIRREQREGGQGGDPDAPKEQVWRSGVRFRFPILGQLSATVTLVGEQVHIQMQADSEQAVTTLRAYAGQLEQAMNAAGAPLASLTISEADDD